MESSGHVPRSDIAGSHGICTSTFLRIHTDFQNGCNSLSLGQQWMRAPLSPHHHQLWVSVAFVILAILSGNRWNLRAVWLLHSFRYFLFILVSSSEDPQFTSATHYVKTIFFIVPCLFSFIYSFDLWHLQLFIKIVLFSWGSISDPHWFIFVWFGFAETKSFHVARADLKLSLPLPP